MIKNLLFAVVFCLNLTLTFAQPKAALRPMAPNVINDANYRVGCSLFTDPNNYSNGSSFTYNAPTNNNSYLVGPGGANYGCMGYIPNQAWFIITVNSGGNLYFNFSNSNNYDVDAVIWGPLANNDMANACSATQNYPLTCDYDAARPDLYINNAQAGQKYVMLVTNYSNANTTIYITQPTGGSVTYSMVNLPNCSLIPSATLSGTNTSIVEGQSTNLTLSFSGSSPWNYTLSDGTTGQAYTSPINLTVYPTASQTYTVSSVSNLCGTSGGTGSVGISVTRNTQLRSCFPLDGNAIDSQSGLNSGSLQNGVTATTNRNSEANKALQFDGIDDYVNIQSNQLNNNTFAYSAWVKLDQLPDVGNPEMMVFSLGSAFDQHYFGVEYTNGSAAWKFSSNGSTVYSGNIVDTGWHLLVGVRTGGQLKIYVDGFLSNTINASGAASYDNPLSARIGSSIANNKFFKGKIDDFKIFNGSLIDPEVQLLLNSTTCNNVVNETFLAVQSISTSVICTGSAFVMRAYSNNLTPDPELNFVAELSNSSGSFSNSTIVGSSTFLPVTVTIPSNIAGGNYKLRMRYGGTISVNSFDIFVNNPATHNITGTVALNDGQSTNLSLNFTGTGPWNYVLSNGLSGIATTNPWVISVTPDQSTSYSITTAQNVCGTSSLNGNSIAIVSVNFTKEFISCFPFTNNATDTKGNNTATVQGPLLSENRYGQTNAAYSFDGIDDRIEYSTNLLRKREFTMSAWVMMNSIPSSTQYILSQGEFSTNTFQGIAVSSSGWQFQSASSSGLSTAYSSTNLVANQWVHLTAVRTYQSLKLYVNGDLVSTVSNSSLIPFKISDIGRVGASSSSLSNFINGKIDDVRLYKGALTDDEVFALYSNVTDCPDVQNASIIVVRSVTPTTVCAGNNISVAYTSTNVGISGGSPLNVVLSDQFGGFTNPTIIGSGSTSPISAVIPTGLPSSSLYRVRLVSTSGTPINSVNTRTITINGSLPSATLSGGGSIQFGQNATLTLNFTGNSPWTFALNNGSSQTVSTSPYSFTISPFSTTTYTITSLNNSCGNGTGTGTATVTVAPYIGLNNLASTALCTGVNFNVSFQANFTPANNIFRVELSDISGNFTNPVNIGTGSTSPISVNIPNTVSTGSGYKLRVVSDNPATQSAVSSTLTITQRATATISGGTTINEGQSANLTINFTGQAPWTYSINNGSSQTTSTNPLVISVSPVTTTTYTITSLSSSCGTGTTVGSAVITVNEIPMRLVSCFPFNGNANDSKGLNNGTVYGATLTTDRFGNANSAYSFDGNDDYISYSLNGISYQNNTLTTWFNMTSTPVAGWRYIMHLVSNEPTRNPNVGIYISTGGYLYLSNSNINTNTLISNQALTTNQWYHIAVTSDITTYKIYFNGSLVITGSYNFGGANINFANNSFGSIGKAEWNESFNGKIDDVQIYKGALTAEQVSYIYNSQLNCSDPTVLPFLSLSNLSSSSYCYNQLVTIPLTALNISPTVSNPINIELSDVTGSFLNPTVIGTTVFTNGNVSAYIPNNITSGTGYKIRLKHGSTISNLSSTLTINAPVTASLSGTTTINEGQSANLTINFTGTAPYTYAINNGISQSTSSNPLTISVYPLENTNYTITSLTNVCGSGSGSGSAVITVNPVAVRLVSCYPFNGNANDSKNLNNGTVNGVATLTTDRFGNANSAYSFDGGYIQIGINGIINTNQTFSLWFRLNSTISSGALFSVWATPRQMINQFESGLSYLNSNSLITYQSNILQANIWYHFVLSKSNNIYSFYLNGNLIKSDIIPNDNSTDSLPIAQIGSGYLNTSFIGKIDDVQIYKGALTDSQVRALYNNSTTCYDASTYTCLSNATYNSILSGQQVLQVSNQIIGNSTIQTNSNIHFDSKNSVLLQPGFKTESNTVFRATAGGGCF